MYPGAHRRDAVAILQADTGATLTYGDLDDRSSALARYLRDQGLGREAGVAFLSENAPEVFEVYWAGLRSGLLVTGVNYQLTADEAAYILNDCAAQALIVSSGKAELARELRRLVPSITVALAYGGPVEGFSSYEEALQAGAMSEPLAEQPRGADMLYSSGTTGRPKGVRPTLTGRQVHELGDATTAICQSVLGFDADTVYYSVAPTYHAAPLRYGAATHALGGQLIMRSAFDAEQTLKDIERYRVTAAQFVPTMFVRLLKLPEDVRAAYDLSSLKVALHAAAPCPVDVKQEMLRWWGPIIHEYYSGTELNGATMIDPQTWREHPGSVGRAVVGIIHICDDDGAELPVGETGLVYFERDQLPFVYHNDPEKTRAAQHPEHETWTTTGDIGRIDEDGYLYLTDRKAFTIISGGTNIYPQEIENALALHPAVLDVAVVGLPDDDWGQIVTAVIQTPPGLTGTPALAEEIVEFLRGKIARFKLPRRVDFADELPRTPTGKLVKRLLVERLSSSEGS